MIQCTQIAELRNSEEILGLKVRQSNANLTGITLALCLRGEPYFPGLTYNSL